MRCFVGLILVLLASCPLVAQPVAKILGPSRVPPGELTALTSAGSVGGNLTWITPPGLTTILAGCELMDSQIFFATSKAGSYEFLLVVADKNADIAYARHTVVVGPTAEPIPDPGPGPQPDPGPGPEPGPTPGKWAGLVDVSRQGADSAADAATRAQLKTVITAKLADIALRCGQSQCPTLQQAQREVESAIESVLLYRADRFSKWKTWRLGNGNFIAAKGLKDLDDYLAAVKAFTAGL